MEKIILNNDNKTFFMDSKKIKLEDIPNVNNEVSKKILKLISKNEMYPKQIAKSIGVHEQNVYYYIKKLEKSGIICVKKQENINGTIANFYGVSSSSFYFNFGEFKESPKLAQKESEFLIPFIEKGELNALIVVGSPDPHGPQKARSKDGYFGMDLALFLGTYLNSMPTSRVKLDTEVTQKELEENNLIVIGGPIVNKVSSEVNSKMKIYFDEEKKGIYSKVTRKTYFSDEIGFFNKFKSPFNSEKKILLIAGLRNSGTKAAILAFLKHFNEVEKGNEFDGKIMSRVVEGVDLDSDGKVDEVEFLE